MKKAGRTERVNMRLTVAERAAIDRGAKHARKDVTSFVLERVLSAQEAARLLRPEPPPEPTPEPVTAHAPEPAAQGTPGWLSWLLGHTAGRGA
jgi:hypothetical protein